MKWIHRKPASASPPLADRATLEDITLAYRLILKRDPDPEGLAAYQRQLEAGMALDELISSLLSSSERRERLASPRTVLPTLEPSTAQKPAAIVEPSHEFNVDPSAVIARYSVEELNKSADGYYRRMTDPGPLLRKPFAFPGETPEMLENLGALIGGLRLGKAMTVLDFGAGTCWLSRLIAQLNCQMICCDASEAALEIGRRLFREHPPIGGEVIPPQFLHFDGHRLELDDESVDRIICFDAFHHIPNQAEVLAELGRVLRPGGIAGFSEPGRFHARAPQAQYEMKNFCVLENNIELELISEKASAGGFTDVTVRALNDLEMSLPDYLALIGLGSSPDSVRAAAWERMRETMLNRTVFFLHKGELRLDSRGPAGLAHVMEVEPVRAIVGSDFTATLRFRIRNAGSAYWLHDGPQIHGLVRLASHLYNERGELVDVDFSRHPLPHLVAPGENVEMDVRLAVPAVPSTLRFDLVSEGVRWFENEGSVPVTVKVVGADGATRNY